MRGIGCLLIGLLTVGIVTAQRPAPTPKFKLGKDTTYISEPLDAEGFVDYETALNDRLRGKIKPEENAVTLLVEAIGPKLEGKELHADFFKWLGTKPLPAKGEYYVPLAEAFKDELAGDGGVAFNNRLAHLLNDPWTAKDDPALAKWLAANDKPLAKVVEAVKRRAFFLPHIGRDGGKVTGLFGSVGSDLPLLFREFTTAFVLRVQLLCGQQKYDAAWQDILTIHRLGRHVACGGTLLHYLVGVAIEQIASYATTPFLEIAKPTAKRARQYADDLLALPATPPLGDLMDLAERYIELDSLRVFRREGLGPLSYTEKPKPTALQLEASVGRLDFEFLLRVGNATTDSVVKAFREPTRAGKLKAFAAIQAEFPNPEDREFKPLDPLTDIEELLKETDAEKLRTTVTKAISRRFKARSLSAFAQMLNVEDRVTQVRQNLLVAVSLAGHFAETGKYPAKLADLAPQYLAKVPDDLFSGKPLVYKPTKDGYLFYSVGINGTDDGGKLLTDPVVNPADSRGDDLGVRVPRAR